jgi:uncharacterized membrane protein (DUF106 family)
MIEVIRVLMLTGTVITMYSLANGHRQFGLIVGLLGQPFWFFIGFYHEDWGIVVVAILITLSYMKGMYKLVKDPFHG